MARLDLTIILWEMVLSAAFISLGYLRGSLYLRGVGVGLLIACVTSTVAYL